MTTFWNTESDKKSATGESNTDVTWTLPGNGRVGANVNAGDVKGRFELGFYGPTASDGDTNRTRARLLYASWKWLLVGKNYTPINYFASNQVWGGDTGLLPYGGIYDGRRPMIQGTFGGFKIALVEPSTGDVVTAATSTDVVIPKIEAAYTLKAGPASLKFMGGYNTYQEEDTVTDETYTIDSYMLGLGFNIGAGPATIKGNIYYGQNTGNFGMWQVGAASATYNAADDDIDNTTTLGYLLAVAVKAGPTITLEAGYAGSGHDSDLSGSKTDNQSGIYVQANIALAKAVWIVPEIGYIDYGDNSAGVEEGTQTYFGAKWQINF
jgi:hypothetical protein